MKLTPHQIVAAIILILAVAAAFTPLTTSAGGYNAPVRDYRIDTGKERGSLVPADRPLGPVVKGLPPMDVDPFTMKRTGGANAGDLPPTPPFAVPALPVLPLPGEK